MFNTHPSITKTDTIFQKDQFSPSVLSNRPKSIRYENFIPSKILDVRKFFAKVKRSQNQYPNNDG